MNAGVLKQDPNTKRFKRMLIYFNTDTQYANFRGNPLYQATKRHLNNLPSTEQAAKTQPKQDLFFFHFSSFLTVYMLFKCRFVA